MLTKHYRRNYPEKGSFETMGANKDWFMQKEVFWIGVVIVAIGVIVIGCILLS